MFTHELARAMLFNYAKLAGYRGKFALTLSKPRFDATIEAGKFADEAAARADETGEFGAVLPHLEPPLVWINPRTNTISSRLCRTAAHEALHLAMPTLPHGRGFDRRVAALLRLERL